MRARILVAIVAILCVGACSVIDPSSVPRPQVQKLTDLDRALQAGSIPFRTIYTGYWPKFEYPPEKEYVVFGSQDELDTYLAQKEMAEASFVSPLDRPIDFTTEDGVLVLSRGYPQGTTLEILAVEEAGDERTVFSVTWTCEMPETWPSGLSRDDHVPVCNEEGSRPYHLIAIAKSDRRIIFEPLLDASSVLRPMSRPWPFPWLEDSESWKTNPRGGPGVGAPPSPSPRS